MKSLSLILFSFISLALFSQDAIITERPGQSDSPNSIPKGALQIETGILFQRSEISSTISQKRIVTPTNLFRIGLTDRVELRLLNEIVEYRVENISTSEEISSVSGTENMQLGFKYQINKSESKTTAGLIGHIVFPTGSRGISNQKYGLIGKLSITHELGESSGLATNLIYNNSDLRFTDEGLVRDLDGNFFYTLIYSYSVNNSMGVFIEFYGDYVNFKNWQNSMDAGISYQLRNNLQFDYSFGWGMNQVMNYHAIGVSLLINRN